MHSKIKSVRSWLNRKAEGIDKGRMLYTAFLISTAVAIAPVRAYAAGDTIWTKASEIMQDVYTLP